MRISDWNEDDNEQYNVMFDITDSSNSLLCFMTYKDLLNMIDDLERITETGNWEKINVS